MTPARTSAPTSHLEFPLRDQKAVGGRTSQALALLRPELLAMEPALILPVNLDVPAAAMTVLGSLELVRSFEPALTGIFGADATRPIERLELLALAALGAHAQWRMVDAGRNVRLQVRELTGIRDVLRAEAGALILHRVIAAGVIDELVGGKRSEDLCLDVLQLVSVFQRHWDVIEGGSGVGRLSLVRAENLADELLLALAERGQRQLSPAADLRNRAFSLMVHTYDDVQRLITFLRWKERDYEAIAPSLWAKRAARPRPQRKRTKADATLTKTPR